MKILNITSVCIVLSVLFCYSCNTGKPSNNDIETINIENLKPSKMAVSEFAESMEVVKLETTTDCVLGGISLLRLSSEYIYIKDQFFKGIYVFDKKGNLVMKLDKNGDGPEEYREIRDFIVDEQSNTLEVYDNVKNKLIIYSLSDLSFIKDLSIKLNSSYSSVIKKGNLYYLCTSGFRNYIDEKPTNSEVIVYNTETNKYTPVLETLLPDEKNQYRSGHFHTFSVYNRSYICTSFPWQDICYKIDGVTATPVLSIYAGSQGVPESIKNGTYDERMDFMNSSSSDNKFVSFRLYMFENDDFMILCQRGGFYSAALYYYMRLNNHDYFIDAIQNDFIAEKLNLQFLLMEQNYFYTYIIPESEPSGDLKQYMELLNIGADDNPVLLLFKLKSK